MMCERSSGKAHYKATKFFDFTAPPLEKNIGMSHQALTVSESPPLITLWREGGEGQFFYR